jgi:hypothetical protein
MEIIVGKNYFCFDPFHLMKSDDIIHIVKKNAYDNYHNTNYDSDLWFARMIFIISNLIKNWCHIRDEQHPEWTWRDFSYYITGYHLKNTIIQNKNYDAFKDIMNFETKNTISMEFINIFFEKNYPYFELYYKEMFEWNHVCSGPCIPNEKITKIIFKNDVDMDNSHMFSFLELYCKKNNIILEKKYV